MSFQAYLDTIEAKTGMTPDDFLIVARQKGYLEPGVKTTQIIDWLKQDYGLGRGHAMALTLIFNHASKPKLSHNELIDHHFTGSKIKWRESYDRLFTYVSRLDPGITAKPVNSYINFVKNGKKFAIVQVTTDHLSIGIKRKGAPFDTRFKPAGTWNSMVTHRIDITEPGDVDADTLNWLKQASDAIA